jgi:hypothetical protein
MIPRLRVPNGRRRGSAGFDRDERDRFASAGQLRDIIVVIDNDLLTESTPAAEAADDKVEPRALLSRLLTDPYVRLYRYADDGPPPTLEPIREDWGTTVYEGWAVVTDTNPGEHLWQVVFPTKKGFTLAGVIGNAIDVAARDTGSDAYRDLDEGQSRKRRQADMLAAMVAEQAMKADLYITDRPYLHDRGQALVRDVTICHPEDAL